MAEFRDIHECGSREHDSRFSTKTRLPQLRFTDNPKTRMGWHREDDRVENGQSGAKGASASSGRVGLGGEGLLHL